MHLWSFPICTGIQTCCPMPESSDTQLTRGSAHMGLSAMLFAQAWQPTVEGSDVWKPPAHAGSLHGCCGSRLGEENPIRVQKSGEDMLSLGSWITSSWRGTHRKSKSPHVLVLLLHSPPWPLLEAEFGVRGIFSSQVKLWGCREQCGEAPGRSSPLFQQPLTATSPTVPALQSPTSTAPSAQHWTFLSRCFLCDSVLSG